MMRTAVPPNGKFWFALNSTSATVGTTSSAPAPAARMPEAMCFCVPIASMLTTAPGEKQPSVADFTKHYGPWVIVATVIVPAGSGICPSGGVERFARIGQWPMCKPVINELRDGAHDVANAPEIDSFIQFYLEDDGVNGSPATGGSTVRCGGADLS